jgi:hypothetical protein
MKNIDEQINSERFSFICTWFQVNQTTEQDMSQNTEGQDIL